MEAKLEDTMLSAIRTIVSVAAAYRKAHPDAPRVVVGDISREGGGPMDEHVSHQNGLDADVYFPRLDHELRAPVAPGQIDSLVSALGETLAELA